MTPDDDTIRAACRLVAEALARPAADIAPDGSIFTVPAWDSLGHVRVLLALEAAIGRPLPSDSIAALTSVTDIAVILADGSARGGG